MRAGQVLVGWGSNHINELGPAGSNLVANSYPTPVQLTNLGPLANKTIVQVSSCFEGSLALTSDGQVYAWGRNAYGQLGNGTTVDSATPVAVDTSGVLAGKTIVAICEGSLACYAIDSNGAVYAWGNNEFGELGNNSTVNSTVPVAVDMTGALAGHVATSVCAGNGVAFVLTSDGNIFGWGNQGAQTLGTSTYLSSYRLTPVAVYRTGTFVGKFVTAIASSFTGAMCLASDGSVYAWGATVGNGNNSTTDSPYPVPVLTTGVMAGDPIASIACGGYAYYCLGSSGRIYAWGSNSYGQLGNGTSTSTNTPINTPVNATMSGVMAGKTITALAGNWGTAYALDSQGMVYSWGASQLGSLGINTNSSTTLPIQVDTSGILGTSQVTKLATGCGWWAMLAIANTNAIAAPVITAQPVSSTVTSGNTASFSVTATGSSLAYQWYFGASPISGATSASLSFTASSASAGSYSVVISNSGGSVTSSVVSLTVQPPPVAAPVITAQPVSSTVTSGNTASFSVTATGSSLAYQWYFGASPISGATSASLSFTASSASAGSYSVVVSNSGGSVTSNVVSLTVQPPPVASAPAITIQPIDLSVPNSTTNFTLSVTATGSGLSYQWYKGTGASAVALPGATNASLTTTIGDPNLAVALYYVVISNASGSITSRMATVSSPLPIITSQPADASVPDRLTNASFSVTVSGIGVSYQWYRGSGASAVAISGATSAVLTTSISLPNLASDHFYVVVTNASGSVTSRVATLSIPAPVILAQPSSLSVPDHSTSFTLSVTASGGGLSYQWYHGSGASATALSGATSASLTTTVSSPSAYRDSYYVVVSNVAGSATSSVATVSVGDGNPPSLVNGSVRAVAGQGADTLIVGFVLSGTSSKSYLVRGVGPTLANYGVPNPLPTPQLSLWDSSAHLLASNSTWGGSAALANAFTLVSAFPLPSNSADCALLQTLAPGAYTAQIVGTASADKVALAEIYDTALTDNSARLFNLSGRAGHVGQSGNVLIAGFVIRGSSTLRVLIRGIGPTLANYGVSPALANPKVTLYDALANPIASNDDWAGDPTLSNDFTSAGAFALPSASKDAAVEVTLQPGAYTAVVSSSDGSIGVALVEVYALY